MILIEEDPVWQAAMNAPIDATPHTEEEIEALEYVRRHGLPGAPGDVVSAEIERREEST